MANFKGADPAAANIGAACDHAVQSGLKIDYRATTAEALADVVGDLLADGLSAPIPRRVEQMLADPDVGRAMAAGSVLAMVPLVLHSGRTVRANLSIDAGILADIDQEANRLGVTRSAYLTAAAIEKMKVGA